MTRNGFSLAELLVVLAIMAALVCGAVPYAAKSRDSQKLRQQSFDIAAALSYLRDQAINTNRPTRFVLNLKERSYRLEVHSDDGQRFVPAAGFWGRLIRLGEDFSVTEMVGFEKDGSDEYLVFDPWRSWPAGEFTLAGPKQEITIKVEGIQIELINP